MINKTNITDVIKLSLSNYLIDYRSQMKLLYITFGILLFSSLSVTMSMGQGYVRLSRGDPLMSILSQNHANEDVMPDESDSFGVWRQKWGKKKNFLDFIVRKYYKNYDLGARDKRIVGQQPLMIEPYLRPNLDYLDI